MSKKLFKAFQDIDAELEEKLLEISVKKTQMVFIFLEDILTLHDILKIKDLFTDKVKIIYTIIDEHAHVMVDNILLEDCSSTCALFVERIGEISEKICQCPALEYVVSEQYIKAYLDKPGLMVKDLVLYEDVFNKKDDGTLELHAQRPYILFVNMDFALEEG